MPADAKEPVADRLAEILRLEIQDAIGCQLAQDQVRIYNESAPIPPDDRVYVIVAFRRSRPFGASKKHVSLPSTDPSNPSAPGTLVEVQEQQCMETYCISVFSADERAQHYKNEVIFALRSDRAESSQEIHGYKIGDLPEDFVDASAAEASAILNRYDLTFNVIAGYRRERDVPYYDVFVKPGIVINQ